MSFLLSEKEGGVTVGTGSQGVRELIAVSPGDFGNQPFISLVTLALGYTKAMLAMSNSLGKTNTNGALSDFRQHAVHCIHGSSACTG